jgi:CRP-like cAMP-binding protein
MIEKVAGALLALHGGSPATESIRTSPEPRTGAAAVENHLLAAIPRSEYQRLLAGLEPVTMTFGEVLYEPGEPIRHVYFPGVCLVSLLTLVDRHLALEVGLVGNEGMVGVPLALGDGVSSIRALVQGAGVAMRMESSNFLRELRRSPHLQHALNRYTHTLMVQVAQTAACNRFHVVEERLARWLLMTRDRVQSNDFRMTQEFLSHMLGVRRVGITKAASALQRRELITYSRGNISILDGAGLEAASCGCYQVVKNIQEQAQDGYSKRPRKRLQPWLDRARIGATGTTMAPHGDRSP